MKYRSALAACTSVLAVGSWIDTGLGAFPLPLTPLPRNFVFEVTVLLLAALAALPCEARGWRGGSWTFPRSHEVLGVLLALGGSLA